MEENDEFAINTIKRHKTRLKFETKMGDITYTFRRYTRMSKCLIPINENYFLILTLYDFDKILRKKSSFYSTRKKELRYQQER